MGPMIGSVMSHRRAVSSEEGVSAGAGSRLAAVRFRQRSQSTLQVAGLAPAEPEVLHGARVCMPLARVRERDAVARAWARWRVGAREWR